ncbi:DUF1831 domain-containing protein [Loigolactobacillus zhaoyuanensis]|uniref:DUF1831 domain-containing protein n=1 Tax=Loigolactobacillus zhaoyuanensis TaxID=2486017 RepID=A0ABW8U8E4_9LACO|nr:DUF1831 domain-containing protein [Loigolactobacillus zhaoyuanensis]
MAFAATATIKGNDTIYALHLNVKKYTLKDVGFTETRGGNFQLERPLDPNSPYNQAFKLKITVAKDLQNLKMSITTANGLQAVDIFKQPAKDEEITQFNFLMDNLIEREILIKK